MATVSFVEGDLTRCSAFLCMWGGQWGSPPFSVWEMEAHLMSHHPD